MILSVALGAACACGGGGSEEDELAVRVDAVAPTCGSSAAPTELKLTGNMPEKPLVAVVDPSGHPVTVAYRAWLGESELTDVRWVDPHTVVAVVPPMSAGTYELTVQGPLGGPVKRHDAFRVTDTTCPSPTADLVVTSAVASPATLVVGEAVTVTASVENRGLATAKGVSASIASAPGGFAAAASAPPAQDVPAGESRTFTWTYTAMAVDGGKFAVTATGTAADTSKPVAAAPVETNEVLINARSFLACVSSVSPATASVGQVLTVTLVATSHAADAIAVAPEIRATGPVTVASQPQAATVPANGSATFTWTYRTTAAGTATFVASARGSNAGTGEQVTVATAQATVTVQAAAALATTVTVSPSTVAGSQSKTVTVSAVVRNTGGATATGVTVSVAAAPGGTTPPSAAPAAQNVASGQSGTFTWVYAVGASPGGTFSVDASGRDANDNRAITAARATSGALVVTYTVGASVTGLTGSGLVLRNGNDSVSVSSSSTITFPTAVANGGSYSVTIGTQPTGQTCTVSNGSGTIATANVTASVSCSTNTYTLSTTVSPSGGGTISCNGGSCASSYAYGTALTLTASASAGYTFSGWSGDCSGTASCSLTMDASHSVAANFTANTYALSATANPSGGGTIACNGGSCASTYAYNTALTLTAAPAAGYDFTGWSGDCSGSTCALTMNANHSVTANFTAQPPQTFSLTTGVTPNGGGTIACGSSNPCPATSTYTAGTQVALTATPGTGYTFSSWSGGGCGTANPCTVTMSADTTVTANFTTNSYTLSATASPTNGGSISCNGGSCASSYAYNTALTLTAAPAAGYDFTGWSGDCSGTTCSLTMSANHSVTANFAAQPPQSFSLTTSVTPSGAGTVACDGGACASSYTSGTQVSLTATPGTGYTFSSWSGGGCGSANPCVVTMNADTTVTASFTANAHAVHVTVSGLTATDLVLQNGSDSLPVNADGTYTFPTAVSYGASYDVVVGTPPTGQACSVANGSGTMPDADVTATVTCN